VLSDQASNAVTIDVQVVTLCRRAAEPPALSQFRALSPESERWIATSSEGERDVKVDFDGRDFVGGSRFRVWHPDGSGRVVYITVDGGLPRAEQLIHVAFLVASDTDALEWRPVDDYD
jgi:hypothetical protein